MKEKEVEEEKEEEIKRKKRREHLIAYKSVEEASECCLQKVASDDFGQCSGCQGTGERELSGTVRL